jgi:oxygen tolerance protein BatD
MLLSAIIVKAQQDASALPSLLNNQAKKDAGDDEITTLLKQKMFVKVTTNTNKAFVGEPIMATYKFYVSMHVNDQPTVTKQPEFSGCSVKELNFQQGPEFENINNETYAVYTIRKVQLTPLNNGRLSMGKAFVNNFIQVDNPDDPFVTKKYNFSISNNDEEIEVAALPLKNKPTDFYGITGTFNIAAAVADAKIPVGENGHLIITINGSGNLEAINKPEIVWPANVDRFDGTDSQHIDQDDFPVSGNRVFDIPFVGKKEGTIIIPPIHFSFFNTSLKDYQTISTNNISVLFTKALARKDVYKNVVDTDISNRKYLWIVPAIAVVVALIGFVSYKRNQSKKIQLTKAEASVTTIPVFEPPQPVYRIRFRTDFSRSLTDLEAIKENKPFFARSKNLLTQAVAERIDSNEHSEQILISGLKERTYNAPVCNKVSALYEAININLYAPFETEADLAFYFTELKQTIVELQAEN